MTKRTLVIYTNGKSTARKGWITRDGKGRSITPIPGIQIGNGEWMPVDVLKQLMAEKLEPYEPPPIINIGEAKVH